MANHSEFPPITVLPVLLSAASEALDASEEQLRNFRRAKDRPYSLDNKTLHDVIRSFTQQRKNIEQQKLLCTYWRSQRNLSAVQKKKINELETILERMEERALQILSLAQTCQIKTIEKLIDQEDAEVAISALQEWFSTSEEPLGENDFSDDDSDDDEDYVGDEDEDFDIEDLECHHCGEIVARLIYLDEATTLEELEDAAADLLPSMQDQAVPTWMIAEDDCDLMEEPWQEESLIKPLFPFQRPQSA